jgi:hypothetical protein
MEKIILYENGKTVEILFDPNKPLWDQKILQAPVEETSGNSSPDQQQSIITHRNIEQETLQ